MPSNKKQSKDQSKLKRLYAACVKGIDDVSKIERLVKSGADVDGGSREYDYTHNRNTPLHTACHFGHISLVRALLNQGADVNARDMSGDTPLMSSVLSLAIGDEDGFVAKMKNVCCIVDVLAGGGSMINARNDRGATALELACTIAYKENTTTNRSRNEDISLEMKLLALGADPNISSAGKMTPLNLSVNCGHTQLVKILLSRGADASKPGEYGMQALAMASNLGHTSVVKALLEFRSESKKNSFDIEAREPKGGNTALHVAVLCEQPFIARLLLLNGAKVNATDKYGHTPLFSAAARGDMGCLTMLLSYGADPNIVVKEKTPLCHAVMSCSNASQQVQIVEALVAAGTDVSLGGSLAYLCGRKEGVEIEDDARAAAVAKALIGAGADVNYIVPGASSLLDLAGDGGHVQVVTALLGSRRLDMAAARASAAAPDRDGDAWTTVRKALRRTCGACGNFPYGALEDEKCKIQMCSSCTKVFYCDAVCQRAHWKAHKIVCRQKRL